MSRVTNVAYRAGGRQPISYKGTGNILASAKERYHLARIVKQARSLLLPHLHQSYHFAPVRETARSSFGGAAAVTLNRIIDSVPLPQIARQAVTHTVIHVIRNVRSFFFD